MSTVPLPEEVDHDAMLMEAVQKQDRDCFSELVSRNDRWVRGVVYSVLTDPNLLDDVMQKVWLAVWQRCCTLDDVRRWRHWLYRMARNAAIDAGRKKQRQRSLRQRFTHEIRGRGKQTPRDPRKTASVKEQHNRVLNAIEVMPAIYKEPFVLRHMEGWSYKEIAETLELPVDTVGTRLVRARRLLQDTLSEVELG
jgi:RNA polymerase sigma-70 factor (ECF subfamily)